MSKTGEATICKFLSKSNQLTCICFQKKSPSHQTCASKKGEHQTLKPQPLQNCRDSNFNNVPKHASSNTSLRSNRTAANKTLTPPLFQYNRGIMQHFSSFSIQGTSSTLHFLIYFWYLFKTMSRIISTFSNYSGTKFFSNVSKSQLSIWFFSAVFIKIIKSSFYKERDPCHDKEPLFNNYSQELFIFFTNSWGFVFCYIAWIFKLLKY